MAELLKWKSVRNGRMLCESLINIKGFLGGTEKKIRVDRYHTVQKLLVIFDKLHRTFDFFIALHESLYEIFHRLRIMSKVLFVK